MAVIGARCDALNVDTSHKDHTCRSSSSTGVCEINARTKIELRFVFESPDPLHAELRAMRLALHDFCRKPLRPAYRPIINTENVGIWDKGYLCSSTWFGRLFRKHRTQVFEFPICGLTVSVEHIDMYMYKCIS